MSLDFTERASQHKCRALILSETRKSQPPLLIFRSCRFRIGLSSTLNLAVAGEIVLALVHPRANSNPRTPGSGKWVATIQEFPRRFSPKSGISPRGLLLGSGDPRTRIRHRLLVRDCFLGVANGVSHAVICDELRFPWLPLLRWSWTLRYSVLQR